MLKRTIPAFLWLVFAMALTTPPMANAQVVVGVGVAPFVPRPAYGYVVVQSRPYVYVAPPYVVYAPRYAYPLYVYSGRVFVGGRSTETLCLPTCKAAWGRLAAERSAAANPEWLQDQ